MTTHDKKEIQKLYKLKEDDKPEYDLSGAVASFLAYCTEHDRLMASKKDFPKAKYKLGDWLEFDIKDEDKLLTLYGEVVVVDRYGTFEQNEEPSYDVRVPDYKGMKDVWFKHIRQSLVREREVDLG